MDRRTELMVSLGAAVGANCIPCFDHLCELARQAQLTDEEIRAVAAIGFKVKKGAAMFLQQAVDEYLGGPAPRAAACCEAVRGACA